MRFRLEPRKQALIAAGLLAAVGAATLGTSSARANTFLGVDLGPVSIGVGANTPTYYAPPPVTYVAPQATYVAPPAAYAGPVTTYSYSTWYSTNPFVAVAPPTVIVH